MSVSVDGYIVDRGGSFDWTRPDDEVFRFHIEQTRDLGVFISGRNLYQTMLVWDTDPALRNDESGAAFANLWCAVPKVVFSRTLTEVQGTARLATGSLAGEVAAALEGTDKTVGIGGASLAAQAIELGLVDEYQLFRYPIIVGGGTPCLPPVTDHIPLELIESRTFASRVVYERYRRVAVAD